jgi:hypothetical protein
MSQEVRKPNQIEVDVRGVFTTHHQFGTEEGTLGELTLPAFGQQGVFGSADGRELVIRKAGILSNSYELLEGNQVRGTAHPRALFSRGITIQLDALDYILQPEGVFSRGWYLVDADGTTLLEIRPRGVLRQGAYLTSRDRINVDLLVFAYYLVYTRQQEEAAVVATM